MKKLIPATMKKNLFLIALVIASLVKLTSSCAQAPDWLWAKCSGDTASDVGYGITVDISGNSYVTGYFQSSSITFGTTTLTNSGDNDVFIVKYDASGNVVWAKQGGGSGDESGYKIVVDSTGNSYVTGYFRGPTITFDTTTLTKTGSQDIFIVKFDTAGNLVWAKSVGGIGNVSANGIAVDGTGNSYVTGAFRDSITFDTITITSAGTTDIYIVKYDTAGNVVWAKGAGGVSYEGSGSIAVDGNNNIYVTGSFNSPSMIFDTITLYHISPFVSADIFIVKYDTSGNVVWAKSAGGDDEEFGIDVAFDGSGNSFVTGFFRSPSITFDTTTLFNFGIPFTWEIYVAKYDSAGNVVWVKSIGGDIDDRSNSIAIDGNGNCYITGFFSSYSIILGTTTLSNAGGLDIFTIKFDAAGNEVWAKGTGGDSDEFSGDIVVDLNGNSYVTGFFQSSSINFGPTALTNAGTGSSDMFVARLASDPVAVAEVKEEDGVSVFPNPSTNQIVVQSEKFKIERVEIYNVRGERVFTTQYKTKQIIDISSQASGIYFLKLISEDGRAAIKKIVRE